MSQDGLLDDARHNLPRMEYRSPIDMFLRDCEISVVAYSGRMRGQVEVNTFGLSRMKRKQTYAQSKFGLPIALPKYPERL